VKPFESLIKVVKPTSMSPASRKYNHGKNDMRFPVKLGRPHLKNRIDIIKVQFLGQVHSVKPTKAQWQRFS
jgi:hypothetical protein